jgi:polysaccharide chain length determinant protein (PEP-CTERM system associated)
VDARNQAKQYVDIAWRRRWWIAVPAVTAIAVSGWLCWSLPRVYRATTTILVIRQSVPDDLVRSTVTMHIDERMKSLRVQVMSHTYLDQVAREVGMVGPSANEAQIERAFDTLNDIVYLDWDHQGLSWFKIMVENKDPKRAAAIANRLADLFISQNTAMREKQAKGAVDTIEGWKKDADARLSIRDEKIAAFKRQYLYELPDQEAATLQLLNAAQTRLTQLSSDIQLRSERLATARAEDKARRAAAQFGSTPISTDDPDSATVAQMERELRELLANYTDANPLVRKKREQIADFKATHPGLGVVHTGSGDVPAGSPEVAKLEGEIKSLEADRDREQRNSDELRKRISNMPLRAQELAALTRDYAIQKDEYDKTVGQKLEAQRSQDLEAAKKGEQFQIQDPARPPAVPFKPQVVQILLLGILGGLALGGGLAAALEFLDHTVKSEEEFALQFPELSVLGAIPNLDQDTSHKSGLLGRDAKKKKTAALGGTHA